MITVMSAVMLTIILVINITVIGTTSDRIFESSGEIPRNNVGIVLGTSNKLISGDPNIYFYDRIKTAVSLFNSGKISHIIVSGVNSSKYYNEPLMMKNALISEGIPEDRIYMDEAGIRTLDSIVRGKLVYGQDRFTIITQPFHAYRALFIASSHNIDAVAVVSEDSDISSGFKSKFREIFARTVAVWDLFIVKKMPKHLGEQIVIGIAE